MLNNIFQKMRDSVAELKDNLASLVEKIEKNNRQIQYYQNATPTRDEVKNIVFANLEQRAEAYIPRLEQALSEIMRKPLRDHSQSMIDYIGANTLTDATKIPRANLYWLFLPQLKDRIGEAIDRMDWPNEVSEFGDPPSLEERPKAIEKLQMELAKLHDEYDQLLTEAEQAGIHVERVVFRDAKQHKQYQRAQAEAAQHKIRDDLEKPGGMVKFK